jgi:hypothetical protein
MILDVKEVCFVSSAWSYLCASWCTANVAIILNTEAGKAQSV